MEAPDGERPEKRQRTSIDIREMLIHQNTARQETPPREKPQQELDTEIETVEEETRVVIQGPEEEVELTDWQEAFKDHILETRRLEREKLELKQRAEKKEQSWELLRQCTQFLKENESKWKNEEEDRKTEKQRKEEKNRRCQKANTQSETIGNQVRQQKIEKSMKLLPEHARMRAIKEEEKTRRIELREIKVNLWKKWRKEPKEQAPKPKSRKETQEEWLDTLEKIHEKLAREEENRKKAKEICRERREKLRQEQKTKQEEMLKAHQEKEEKKIKKKMLEERWIIARKLQPT